MTRKGPGLPLYRLVDDESSAVILTAEDIDGFFVGPDRESRGTIVFRAVHQFDSKKRKVENAELHVVNWRGDPIGAYFVGRVSLAALDPAGTGSEHPDYSFEGYTCEFEHAGEIWRRWAEDTPIERGEWARCPAEYHPSWLHVVEEAWFASGKDILKYGTEDGASIDGSAMTTRAGFYCALGEAVNGPGGYFGSNLDALADCLKSSRTEMTGFRLTWRDSARSRKFLGDEFMGAVTRILRGFDVVVSLL